MRRGRKVPFCHSEDCITWNRIYQREKKIENIRKGRNNFVLEDRITAYQGIKTDISFRQKV